MTERPTTRSVDVRVVPLLVQLDRGTPATRFGIVPPFGAALTADSLQDQALPGFVSKVGCTISPDGISFNAPLRDLSVLIPIESSKDTVFAAEATLLRRLFRLCKTCQAQSALSVVVQLPNSMQKKEKSFYEKGVTYFYGADKWTINEWAGFLSSLPMNRSDWDELGIPVLLVLADTGRDMRVALQKSDVYGSGCPVRIFLGKSSQQVYVNGFVKDLPRLSDALAPCLSDQTTAGLQHVFDLCGRVNEWRLDEVGVKLLLVRKATAHNFPLYLRIALQISVLLTGGARGAVAAVHPAWVKELLRTLLDNHVMTYAWTEESIATLRSPIAQPVVDLLRTVLQEQMLHSPREIAYLVPIQHLRSLCSTGPRGSEVKPPSSSPSPSSKWSFLKKSLEAAKRSNYAIRLCMKDLQEAVAKLQSIYPTAFTVADYDAVLGSCEFAATDLEALSLLVEVGRLEPRPDSGTVLLRNRLQQSVSGCVNASDLKKAWVAFRAVGQDMFAPLLSKRLLDGTFPLNSIAEWLDSGEYQELCAPAPLDLLAYLRDSRCRADQFHVSADLFALVERERERGRRAAGEGAGEVRELDEGKTAEAAFRAFLGRYLTEDSGRWVDVVPLLDHRTLLTHQRTVLELLHAHLVLSDGMRFHTAIARLQMTPLVEAVLDLAVVRLLQGVRLGTPSKLLDVNLTGAYPVQITFWARCATFCAELTNLLSHFADLPSLLSALEVWDLKGRSTLNTLLKGWLELVRKLKNSRELEAEDVVANYLLPLQAAVIPLFSDESLREASCAQLEGLCCYKPFFSLVEDHLSSSSIVRGKSMPSILGRIDTRRRTVVNCVNAMQTHRPFLDALSSFVPKLVGALEAQVQIGAQEGEVKQQSGRVLEERSVLVQSFVLAFGAEQRAFLEAFVVSCSPNAASRSVLFKYLMGEQQRQAGGGWADLLDFIASVGAVRLHLLRLLQQHHPPFTFDEVMTVGTVLKSENRSPDRELQLLADFFLKGEKGVSQNIRETLSTVLHLYGLREPLQLLVFGRGEGRHVMGTLQRFDFSCASEPDDDYALLVKLVGDLRDTSVTSGWDVSACRERLQQLHCLLCPALIDPASAPASPMSHETLLGLLSLFEHLSAAEHVWEFVHAHPEFVAENGKGYSGQFHTKVEDFLSQLGGEDLKVLDNFIPVAHWVAVLVANQKCSFRGLMQALASSERVMEQARQPQESKPFSQLRTAAQPQNIDYISSLFRNGVARLDAVLGEFQSIDAHCTYIFDLQKCQLRLIYLDKTKGREVELSDAEVVDFQQRLGFIQHDEKAQGLSIMPYLGTLQQYRRWLTLMCELRALGHRDWTVAERTFTSGSEVWVFLASPVRWAAPLCQADLTSLPELLHTWGGQLEEVVTKNPLLCLFSISAAQRLDALLKQKASYELALMLVPLFPRRMDFVTLCTCVQTASASAAALSLCDWPMRVASFLGEVMDRMGTKSRTNTLGPLEETTSSCGSPTRYSAESSHAHILRLLVHIFRAHGRAPQAFEVLWCDQATAPRVLLAFLERARHHPSRPFVLLQVEQLVDALQHALMRLFLDSRNSHNTRNTDAPTPGGNRRVGHNVHCVETGPSILQSVSWIPALSAETLCASVDLDEALKSWVFDEFIGASSVQCFYGAPGSGKTHQLRKSMAALSDFAQCTVSITEAFEVGGAARKLQRAMLEGGDGPSPWRAKNNLAVAFQINLGKYKHAEHEQWAQLMQKVSKFFFRLLVLRSVEDPVTGWTFNLPRNCHLRVYVEVPDRVGHLERPPSPPNPSSAPSQSSDSDPAPRADHPLEELPVLAALSGCVDAGEAQFDVQDDAAHVTKYLSAYESGAIDQLYATGGGGRDMIFVLDNSGSMQGGPLETCKRCIQNDIFATRVKETDRVGLIVFNSGICVNIPLQRWDPAHSRNVQQRLAGVQATGGTAMWTAILHAKSMLHLAGKDGGDRSTWIVALTDGGTADTALAPQVRSWLQSEPAVRVIFITVNLHPSYEQPIRQTCMRDEQAGDAMVRADGGLAELAKAWADVGDRLTVSERIEQQGASITPDESRRLLRKYMDLDGVHSAWSRQKQTHWIRYLFRRAGILAASEKFNKNKDMPTFGSTTMQIMLQEVEHALDEAHQKNWHTHHEQLVYCREDVLVDGERVADYKWSVLATHPDSADPHWAQRKKLLKSLHMHVPTAADLGRKDRRVLDSYLAHGLGIELSDVRAERSSSGEAFDFALGCLPVLDQQQFVLTLDFAMKMLCMNERIECRVPCIIEGETGVSKTALTRMLFQLKNARSRVTTGFAQAVLKGAGDSQSTEQAAVQLSVLRSLADFFEAGEIESDSNAWHHPDQLAEQLCTLKLAKVAECLLFELRADVSLDPLPDLAEKDVEFCAVSTASAVKLLLWYVGVRTGKGEGAQVDWTFHPVDVHAALTPDEIANDPTFGVSVVVGRANRLKRMAQLLHCTAHNEVTLCIFFDEINTSICMGVFKEIVVDHSLNGERLPDNIVVIAACNPARDKIELAGDRCDELGNEWAVGHYQVRPLPQSMQQMAWDYGSLKPEHEREFIEKRLHLLDSTFTPAEVASLSKLIYSSQQTTREFARDHIASVIAAKRGAPSPTHMPAQTYAPVSDEEITARAGSAVSLRDILRVFKLFSFFCKAPEEAAVVFLGPSGSQRSANAILLSVAVVYYLRLGVDRTNAQQDFRKKFRGRLQSVCGTGEADIDGVLARCMEALMQQTHLEAGIATTRGLQENVFMVVVCTLAQVPLMIVGPPGSSKTLAVTVVAENARGEYSKSAFFKAVPSLIPYHYQCSRRSTSKQIQEVFERAIERQAKEGCKSQCFVFMDEAGLPEEERESLKVLHYYLENHLAVAARVSFVAISNHALDAAKSNRCALLTRAKPDHQELRSVAKGCLGSEEELKTLDSAVATVRHGSPAVLHLDPSSGGDGLLDILCETYDACMSERPRQGVGISRKPPADFASFFGLRDFMHFVKLLGRLAHRGEGQGQGHARPTITCEKLVEALQRNFNGVENKPLRELMDYFMEPFCSLGLPSLQSLRHSPLQLHNPLELMRRSLAEQVRSAAPISRYMLVVDTTTDDSILRGLQSLLAADAVAAARARAEAGQAEGAEGTGGAEVGGGCKTLKLSNFAEDSDVQQIHVISQVKWATEKGQLVLLSQTGSINESFYDLFNQHFRKFEEKSDRGLEVVYQANIAVGAYSRLCRVSQGFQCIVHLSLAELQVAPAPFLNRFEKYRLTQRHLLESFLHRSALLRDLPALGDLLRDGRLLAHVQRLVRQVGPQAFYGFAVGQTIESGLLCLLSGWACVRDVADALERCVAADREQGQGKGPFLTSVEGELEGNPHALDCLSLLLGNTAELLVALQRPSPVQRTVGTALLGQCILRALVQLLLRVVAPEHLLQYPAALPRDLLSSYLQTERFSLAALLRSALMKGGPPLCAKPVKRVVYTRTSAAVLALQGGDSAAVKQLRLLMGEDRNVVSGAGTGADAVTLLSFAQLTREPQLVEAVNAFLSTDTDTPRVLLVIIDAVHTSVNQINFLRFKIDELLSSEEVPAESGTEGSTLGRAHRPVVLLLHSPTADLRAHHTYHTTFSSHWQACFLDSVCSPSKTEGVWRWLQLVVGNVSNSDNSGTTDTDADSPSGLVDPTDPTDHLSSTPWCFLSTLRDWVPLALEAIARCIELPLEHLQTLDVQVLEGILQQLDAARSTLHNLGNEGSERDDVSNEGFYSGGRGGLLHKRLQCLRRVLGAKLGQTSVGDILLRRFDLLWAGEDGSYLLLREQARSKVRALAAGEMQVSLFEALTGEVREMFVSYLAHMVCAIFQDLDPTLLLHSPNTQPDDGLAAAVFADTLRFLSMPPIAELAAPLRPRRVSVRVQPQGTGAGMFPFFGEIARFFDTATAQVLLKYAEEEEEEEEDEDEEGGGVWERLAEDVEDRVRAAAQTNATAAVAVRYLLDGEGREGEGEGGGVAEALWTLYLQTFVARLYPLPAAQDPHLQHRVLQAWLSSHEKVAGARYRVAAMHVAAQSSEDLLLSLAASVGPLAELKPGAAAEELLRIIDGREDVAEQLGAAMVSAFYTLMLEQGGADSSFLSVRRWADAFAASDLQDLASASSASAHVVGVKQVEAMSVLYQVVHGVDDIGRLRGIIGRLEALVERAGKRLSLQEVWAAVRTQGKAQIAQEGGPGMCDADAVLLQRLLEMWSARARADTATQSSLVDTVVSNAPAVAQGAPMLETLLVGHDWRQTQLLLSSTKVSDLVGLGGSGGALGGTGAGGSLQLWLECVVNVHRGAAAERLEGHLARAVDTGRKEYVPQWMEGVAAGGWRASFFHLVWKWLLALHSGDDLCALCVLAQGMEGSFMLRQVPIMRATAATAVRVFVAQRLALRAVERCNRDMGLLTGLEESDLVQGQLSRMGESPCTLGWEREVALFVCSCKSENVDQGREVLNSVAANEGNKAVREWLLASANACDASLQTFKAARPALSDGDLLGQCCLRSVPRFLRVLLARRAHLRLLWVLPDLAEFYAWLTGEFSSSPIPEARAKTLTLGSILESARDTENGSERRQLWVRVKVGVNHFLHVQGRPQDCIDESQSVWSFLSTSDAPAPAPTPTTALASASAPAPTDPTPRADCLYAVLQEMAVLYEKFLAAAGVSRDSQLPAHRAPSGRLARPLDLVAETDWVRVQESLGSAGITGGPSVGIVGAVLEMTLGEAAAVLDREVRLRYEHLDTVGNLARYVGRYSVARSDTPDIGMVQATLKTDLHEWKRAFETVVVPRGLRRVCRFASTASAMEAAYHFQVYHSLEHDALRGLLAALSPMLESEEIETESRATLAQTDPGEERGGAGASGVSLAAQTGQGYTIRDKLAQLYPGAEEGDYLSRAYVDLAEADQRAVLLCTPLTELGQLVRFLRGQLDSGEYLFANKGLKLKQPWGVEVQRALDRLAEDWVADAGAGVGAGASLAESARQLEAQLIQHERTLSASPELPLHRSLAACFSSEAALLKKVPLLQALKVVAAAVSSARHSDLRARSAAKEDENAAPAPSGSSSSSGSGAVDGQTDAALSTLLVQDSKANSSSATSSTRPFEFCGSHYVRLRQLLRAWTAGPSTAAPARPWSWIFLSSAAAAAKAGLCEDEGQLRLQMRPWFLRDPPEVEARRREEQERVALLQRQELAARCILRFVRAHVEWRKLNCIQAKKTTKKLKKPKSFPIPKQSKKQTKNFASIIQEAVSSADIIEGAREEVRQRIKALLAVAGAGGSATIVEDLAAALVDARAAEVGAGASESSAAGRDWRALLYSAQQVHDGAEQKRSSAGMRVQQLLAAQEREEEPLRNALAAGLSLGVSFFVNDQAAGLLAELDGARGRLQALLAGQSPAADLLAALHALRALRFLPSPHHVDYEARVKEAVHEEELLLAGFGERCGAPLAQQMLSACAAWGSVPPSDLLPANDRARSVLAEVLSKLAYNDKHTLSAAQTAVDAAKAALKKPPLIAWEHQQAYLAAASACPTHIKFYRRDAELSVLTYVQHFAGWMHGAQGARGQLLAPVLLLALARLALPTQARFRAACLRRCLVHDVGALMDPLEYAVATSPAGFLPAEAAAAAPVENVQSRWARLQLEADAIPCPSLGKLMGLVGLAEVKDCLLGIYKSVLADKCLPPERLVQKTHNFCLLGNPGTGKTTVARLVGKVLFELGVRGEAFVDTSGEKLVLMGADKAAQLIATATGGTIFVDETYQLEPRSNHTGAAVAMQLLAAAEEQRGDLTVILAGYKEDMEKKLFDFNDGFSSRFPFTLSLEDYDVAELGEMFRLMCEEKNWPASKEVVQVAARRAARGRGNKGFGNARAVRVLFEAAVGRAQVRDKHASCLLIEDVLGQRPDPAHIPELGAALDELDSLIGLQAVKDMVSGLARTAAINYDREVSGEEPFALKLNRVFLGNPGTGKTTVGRIYGRVLKALGLLSKGAWERKLPGDLVGKHVGESEKMTASLVSRSMGKVLFLDEAYGLNNTSYGKAAIDTLVGLVSGEPGEDIAVVMAGYEKQMKKMFRECNEGLSSRFDLKNAFRFEDFGDADLERVILKELAAAKLQISVEVREAVVAELAVLRSRPNFGNARAATAMVSRAKERLLHREPCCRELSKADFGVDKPAGGGRGWADALQGLYKVEHVRKELEDLRATIIQKEKDGKDRTECLQSYIFTGSPGTGKTTVAMALAQMLHGMGILGDSVKVVTGLDLQGSYTGQTKDRVNEAMAEAQGGVLFIDEAYTLGGGVGGRNVFAQEAADQLVALMTLPEHLHRTVVVLAGYPEQMEQMLQSANPGLRSRFTGRMHFPDWDAADCVGRIAAQCEREDIDLAPAARTHLLAALEEIRTRPGWANARDSVTTYDLLYAARARRCAVAAEVVSTFTLGDAMIAMEQLRQQRPLFSPPRPPVAARAPALALALAPAAFLPPPALTRQTEVQAVEYWDAEREGNGATEQKENESEEEREHQAQEQEQSSDEDKVFALLLEVCRKAGYDADHSRRQQLIAILEGVRGGGPFPAAILLPVVEASNLSEVQATHMLRPQVHIVLGGMRNAVAAEEARLAELCRLQEEERAAVQARHEAHMARLRRIGNCVQGFSWHREGSGWRCAGGGHYCSDADLPAM